jgi:hypothetical protein
MTITTRMPTAQADTPASTAAECAALRTVFSMRAREVGFDPVRSAPVIERVLTVLELAFLDRAPLADMTPVISACTHASPIGPLYDASVPSRVRTITIGCHDPVVLARFWSEVTGRPMDHEGDEAWVDIADDPDAIVPDLLFQRVPEGNAPEVRVR